MRDCVWCVTRRWNRLPNRENAGFPYPVGEYERGVFTPHILVPENGRKRGFRDAASGGVQYRCKNTPSPTPIFSTHPEDSLLYSQYETTDCHTLPDHCCAFGKHKK